MAAKAFQGVVIRKQDFSHSDEIVTILCPDQLLTFIALGTRKATSKNRSALQLGNVINAEVFVARLTNRMSKLKTATIVIQPPIQTSDTALVIAELIGMLQHVSHPTKAFWAKLMDTYAYYGHEYNHHIKTYLHYAFIEMQGFKPQTSACVECNRNDRIVDFSFWQGGYICAWHSKNERDIEFLEGIIALTQSVADYIKVSPKANQDIFRELEQFVKANHFL